MNIQEIAQNNKIVEMYSGSKAYGTNLPTSDVDIRGIFCAPRECVQTPFFPVKECVDTEAEDSKLYELSHFMKLCLDCNPNIIELLWTDPADIIYRNKAYDTLRLARSELLSSKIAFTTTGYAVSQLKRIKGHNKWINNPHSAQPPVQKDYISLIQWFGKNRVLPRDFCIDNFRSNARLIPYGNDIYGMYVDVHTNNLDTKKYCTFDDTGSINGIFKGERHLLPIPLAIIKYNSVEYKRALDNHNSYWTWKNNRNAARSELEDKFGFDSKHAMHLVRLMRIGEEALTEGVIHVKRPDAEELLSIRNGAWTYKELIEYADHMDNKIRNELYQKTSLRKYPDLQLASQLLINIQEDFWKEDNL